MTRTSIAIIMAITVSGAAHAQQAVPTGDYPTRAATTYVVVDRGCTQLEQAAGIEQDACGTMPLTDVAKEFLTRFSADNS